MTEKKPRKVRRRQTKLGLLLYDTRIALGLKQRDMASKMRCTQGYLSKVEMGECELCLESFRLAYRLTVSDLVSNELFDRWSAYLSEDPIR